MNTLVKCNCGYYNPADADYCMFCGKPLKQREGSALVVFEDERNGFELIRRLKKHNFELKIFKPTTIFIGNITHVDFIFFIVDIKSSRNREIVKRVVNKFESATKVSIVADEENVETWRNLGIDYIVGRISLIEEVLKDNADEPSLPVYSMKDAESVLHGAGKRLKLLLFLFDGFDNSTITSYSGALREIYNNLKRADIFLLVANLGFIIVPFDQENPKGIEALRNKIENFIKGKTLSKRFNRALIYYFSSGDRLLEVVEKSKSGEKPKKHVSHYFKKPSKKFLDKYDPYSLMMAVDEMGDRVAFLFFDDEYKRRVEPFLTLRAARRIVNIKENGASNTEIERAKDEFLTILEEISKNVDISQEKAFLESLSDDVQLLSLPEIQTNIIMLINEDAPFRKIISEIQKDPVVTAKILRFANSAIFGLRGEIRSVERAAIVLGTEEILGITFSISYLDLFNSKFTKDLYRYSIATLAISKYIEAKASINASITLGSVIHVIGNMFYAQYREKEYAELVKYIESNGIKYEKAEMKFLPARACEVGYKLANLWSFPERVGNVIRNWFFPAYMSKIDTSLHLVHASAVIARALGYFYGGYSIEDMSYHTYNLFYKKFGVNLVSMFSKHKDEILDKIKEMMYILS